MERCTVRWNPRVWPYVTRCVLPPDHDGDHQDEKGRTCPNVPGQKEEQG